MKRLILYLFLIIYSNLFAQVSLNKFYLESTNYIEAPKFDKKGDYVNYNGNDTKLKLFLNKYDFIMFEQAFPLFERIENLNIFEVHVVQKDFAVELIKNFPNLFKRFEDITNNEYELNNYPNDYGLTSPNGPNSNGDQIIRDDLDYIDVERAWDLATGFRITVGLSDARINITDQDLSGKVSFINPSFSQNLPYNPNNLETSHGTGVGSIMIAQGDNDYGSLGICYNCNLISTQYGNYNNIKLLGQNGVRVVNMSWTNFYYSSSIQNVINELVQLDKMILVAAAGNRLSHQTFTEFLDYTTNSAGVPVPSYTGVQIGYPASYEGVISVSGISHRYEANDPLAYNGLSPLGIHVSSNIEDSFAINTNVNDVNNPIGLLFNGYPRYANVGGITHTISPNGIVYTQTNNEFVDLLAPTYDIFNFVEFVEQDLIIHSSGGSSQSAPMVTATAGLMLGLDSCLTPNEVENILKLTSKEVESLPINQNYIGKIGEGALNTGNAVEFVSEMIDPNGVAKISNQIFNRFNYSLKRINNKLEIENAVFTASNTSEFEAKSQIRVLPNTSFSPNQNGFIHLKVIDTLDVSCQNEGKYANKNEIKKDKLNPPESKKMYLFPNPNNGDFRLIFSEKISGEVKVNIYDVVGKLVYSLSSKESEIDFKLNNLNSGVYFVKVSSYEINESIKFIKK